MRRVVQDRAAPDVDRQRTLHEAIAQRFRSVGLAIPFTARVIAADMKPIAVELVEPPFDRDLPVRMLPEKSADDTEPDRLEQAWGIPQNPRGVSRAHAFSDQGAVQRLKFSIAAA